MSYLHKNMIIYFMHIPVYMTTMGLAAFEEQNMI